MNNDNRKQQENSAFTATVDTFATRMKRKLKEQQIKDGESQKATEARHGLMLQSMTTIRKALQETCKIHLGSRFSFELDVTDWEGWPRVQLMLVDSLAPDDPVDALIVTANDNREQGTILMRLRNDEVLGRVRMAEANAAHLLPLVLKKAVRQYLDLIAAYVLNPRKPEEILAQQTKAIEVPDAIDDKLSKEDVFSDDVMTDNNTVAGTEPDMPVLGGVAVLGK